MPLKKNTNCKSKICVSPFKTSPVTTLTYKIRDLEKDLESLKTTYGGTGDADKKLICKVLARTDKKMEQVDQIINFAENKRGLKIADCKIDSILRRIEVVKKLFYEIGAEKSSLTRCDYRNLCRMFSQLTNMEDYVLDVDDIRADDRCRNRALDDFNSHCEGKWDRNQRVGHATVKTRGQIRRSNHRRSRTGASTIVGPNSVTHHVKTRVNSCSSTSSYESSLCVLP